MLQKIVVFVLISVYGISSFAQLEMNGEPSPKKREQLKAPTQVCFEAFSFNSQRILTPNPDFLNTPLGERANEMPLRLWSYGLGLQTGLGKWLRFDAGLQFVQNGERYAYSDSQSDSTFQYENRYRYLGMPMSLNFHWGGNLKLFAGPGITPMIFNQFVNNTQWTTALGSKKEEKLKEKNNEYASSSWEVFGQIGAQWTGKSGWGGMVKAVYRKQVTNTYSKYNEAMHSTYGWGIGIGITKKL
jgi:hypothetical protein